MYDFFLCGERQPWHHALPLHSRLVCSKEQISERVVFFCPGLVKTEDDEVQLKINCGAFMDKSSVYFDTLDLYVDCRKTFVEGCDLLTKPKTEDHRGHASRSVALG